MFGTQPLLPSQQAVSAETRWRFERAAPAAEERVAEPLLTRVADAIEQRVIQEAVGLNVEAAELVFGDPSIADVIDVDLAANYVLERGTRRHPQKAPARRRNVPGLRPFRAEVAAGTTVAVGLDEDT